MANSFRPITNEDLIRKYDLDNLKVDRRRISALNSGLVKTDGILTDFVEQTTKDIEDIQDQLDGNITSWFYEGVPTLNNEPAVNWTTTQLKDDHLGDLYYDTLAGTAYRFIKDNGFYQWNLLRDDAAAQALSIARAAKDTADQKRRVFVVQPTPPYDVGDVWWNTSNNEMYRCIVAETAQGTFHSTDWINDLKYTDDSTAIRLNNELRADVVEDYATKVELISTANSIDLSVNALKVVTDMNHKIFDTLPTPPYAVGDYYIDKVNMEVYDCVTAKAEGESYSSSDWSLDMDLTNYISHAGISVFEDSINMEVSKKVNDDELITRINAQPGVVKINSGKIQLEGYTTINDGFSVDLQGNMIATSGLVGGWIISDQALYKDYRIGDYDYRAFIQAPQQQYGEDTWVFSTQKKLASQELYNGTSKIELGGDAEFQGLVFNKDLNGFGDIILGSGSDFSKGNIWCNQIRARNRVLLDGQIHFSNNDRSYIAGDDLWINGRMVCEGNFTCTGSKNRAVDVDGKKILMNAYETTTPYFGDIGTDKTDAKGICKIEIDKTFKQTIEEDDYKVFVQKLGEGDLYVKKYKDYFEVIGTPNLEFDYEIKAIQKGYKNVRMEEFKEEQQEQIEELKEKTNKLMGGDGL